VRVNNDIRTKN